jgi:hypothetical protein
LNLLTSYLLGTSLARIVLFPYSSCLLRNGLQRDLNSGFGLDFGQVLDHLKEALEDIWASSD